MHYHLIMKKFKQTYHIKASLDQVWQALVDPKVIDDWGGGPAKMEARLGTSFEFWGGDIHGTNTKVVKEKELVQEWISGDWPEPSIVTFTLEPEGEGAKVVLVHEKVPDSEADDIRDGWRQYYLGPMKEYLEKYR
jgi:uncharacterized protein YndB with AHSA1/START domain